jgi:hypothetical protein
MLSKLKKPTVEEMRIQRINEEYDKTMLASAIDYVEKQGHTVLYWIDACDRPVLNESTAVSVAVFDDFFEPILFDYADDAWYYADEWCTPYNGYPQAWCYIPQQIMSDW